MTVKTDHSSRIWRERFFNRMDPERMFARHGGLRWYVLYLLSSGEKRGVDIMEEMEKRSLGYWRPSPGSIYPLLKTLEQEGLIRKGESGYVLTDEGRETIGLDKTGKSRSVASGERAERAVSDIESYIDYLEETHDDLAEHQERLDNIAKRLMEISRKIPKQER